MAHQSSRLIRLKDVLQIIPVCKNTFIEGIRSGRFPVKQIRSGRCVFYIASEIEELVQQMISESSKSNINGKAA